MNTQKTPVTQPKLLKVSIKSSSEAYLEEKHLLLLNQIQTYLL